MAHLLPHLLKNPDLDLTAYARPGSRGIPFLNKIGIKVIEGPWDDTGAIHSLVSKYDIVWDCADSHDPSLPTLLLPALVDGPKKTSFLRISGTGNWITHTGGNADPSARLYDVSMHCDAPRRNSLTGVGALRTQAQRTLDLYILRCLMVPVISCQLE